MGGRLSHMFRTHRSAWCTAGTQHVYQVGKQEEGGGEPWPGGGHGVQAKAGGFSPCEERGPHLLQALQGSPEALVYLAQHLFHRTETTFSCPSVLVDMSLCETSHSSLGRLTAATALRLAGE